MRLNKNLFLLFALVALLAVVSACGGGEPAEEPAAEAPEEAAPAPEPEPVVEPEPEPEEPQGPQLEGNIDLTNEDFQWGEVTDRSQPAPYTWTVAVANDTTQTLDITVRFDFLDDSDSVVKTERTVVRLAPAERTTVEEPGTMGWDEANRVYTFAVQVENWTIIEN
jgi:hypothetical protein